jgi:hypothetical protein
MQNKTKVKATKPTQPPAEDKDNKVDDTPMPKPIFQVEAVPIEESKTQLQKNKEV